MDDAKLKSALEGLSPEESSRLREVWDLLGNEEPAAFPGSLEMERARRRVLAGRDRPPRRRITRRLVGAGALLAAAAVLVSSLATVDRTARPGERIGVTLPDGSQVELNSGSSIEFRRFFLGGRKVVLAGEGFFEVVKGESPFVVQTFDATVRVVGTRFNVRAWPAEKGTAVAVEEGAVLLENRGRALRITRGQTRQVDSDSLAMSVADAIAWLRGDLVFKDQEVGDILDEIRRRYAIQLRLDARALDRTRLSLALRGYPDAEAVVRDLAGSLGIRYRRISNGYELYR